MGISCTSQTRKRLPLRIFDNMRDVVSLKVIRELTLGLNFILNKIGVANLATFLK